MRRAASMPPRLRHAFSPVCDSSQPAHALAACLPLWQTRLLSVKPSVPKGDTPVRASQGQRAGGASTSPQASARDELMVPDQQQQQQLITASGGSSGAPCSGKRSGGDSQKGPGGSGTGKPPTGGGSGPAPPKPTRKKLSKMEARRVSDQANAVVDYIKARRHKVRRFAVARIPTLAHVKQLLTQSQSLRKLEVDDAAKAVIHDWKLKLELSRPPNQDDDASAASTKTKDTTSSDAPQQGSAEGVPEIPVKVHPRSKWLTFASFARGVRESARAADSSSKGENDQQQAMEAKTSRAVDEQEAAGKQGGKGSDVGQRPASKQKSSQPQTSPQELDGAAKSAGSAALSTRAMKITEQSSILRLALLQGNESNDSWLKAEGLKRLDILYRTGNYRIEHPNHAALLLLVALLRSARLQDAEALLRSIEPYTSTLRFFPTIATTASPVEVQFSVKTVRHVMTNIREGIAAWAASRRAVEANRELLRGVLVPLRDRALRLVDSLSTQGRIAEEWIAQTKTLVAEYESARADPQLQALLGASSKTKFTGLMQALKAVTERRTRQPLNELDLMTRPSSAKGKGGNVTPETAANKIRVTTSGVGDAVSSQAPRNLASGMLRSESVVAAAVVLLNRMQPYERDVGLVNCDELFGPISQEEIDEVKGSTLAAEACVSPRQWARVPGMPIPEVLRKLVTRCQLANVESLARDGALRGYDDLTAVLLSPTCRAELSSITDVKERRLCIAYEHAEKYHRVRDAFVRGRKSLSLLTTVPDEIDPIGLLKGRPRPKDYHKELTRFVNWAVRFFPENPFPHEHILYGSLVPAYQLATLQSTTTAVAAESEKTDAATPVVGILSKPFTPATKLDEDTRNELVRIVLGNVQYLRGSLFAEGLNLARRMSDFLTVVRQMSETGSGMALTPTAEEEEQELNRRVNVDKVLKQLLSECPLLGAPLVILRETQTLKDKSDLRKLAQDAFENGVLGLCLSGSSGAGPTSSSVEWQYVALYLSHLPQEAQVASAAVMARRVDITIASIEGLLVKAAASSSGSNKDTGDITAADGGKTDAASSLPLSAAPAPNSDPVVAAAEDLEAEDDLALMVSSGADGKAQSDEAALRSSLSRLKVVKTTMTDVLLGVAADRWDQPQ